MQIDKGTISLTAAAAIIVATFTVGGWAVYIETRVAKLEESGSDSAKLLGAICRKLNCDGEGMRE